MEMFDNTAILTLS